MRISELVDRLLKLQEDLGDVPVLVNDEFFYPETVFPKVTGVSSWNNGDDEHPEMVVLIEP